MATGPYSYVLSVELGKSVTNAKMGLQKLIESILLPKYTSGTPCLQTLKTALVRVCALDTAQAYSVKYQRCLHSLLLFHLLLNGALKPFNCEFTYSTDKCYRTYSQNQMHTSWKFCLFTVRFHFRPDCSIVYIHGILLLLLQTPSDWSVIIYIDCPLVDNSQLHHGL